MLEGAIYFLLKKHFRGEKYYVDLLELFHDVSDHEMSPTSARQMGWIELIDTFFFRETARRCLQVTFQTELGQLIDLITAPEDSVDLSKFSLEKYVHPNLVPSLPLASSDLST